MLGSRVLGRLARAGVLVSAALVCVATSPPPEPSWVHGTHDVTVRSTDGNPASTTLRVVTEGHPKRVSGWMGISVAHQVPFAYDLDAGAMPTCVFVGPAGVEQPVEEASWSYRPWVSENIDLTAVCGGRSPCAFDLELRCASTGEPFEAPIRLSFGYATPSSSEPPPGALHVTEVSP